jgi:hypothetical protein
MAISLDHAVCDHGIGFAAAPKSLEGAFRLNAYCIFGAMRQDQNLHLARARERLAARAELSRA